MVSRRKFIKAGLGYSAIPWIAPELRAKAHVFAGSEPSRPRSRQSSIATDPLAQVTGLDRIVMEGPPPGSGKPNVQIPFYTELNGDAFPQLAHEVYLNKSNFLGPDGQPPRPEEFVDLVVVGGGLAGLTAAYALRHHKPVLLEYADRFGGNSKGETWNNTQYSMGGAYLIDPDPGPLRDTLDELELSNVLRAYGDDDAIEAGGKVLPGFFDGKGMSKEDAAKFEQYRERLQFYAFQDYPELPTADGSLSPTVQDLDQRSLKDEISTWIDGDVPELLASAIQLYCYSSFNAGWEEVSAAAGLNFLAAEEYDLWVYPGGLGQVSRRLWRKTAASTGFGNMRAGMLVFDMRIVNKGVQLTYIDSGLKVRSMVAKAVVMACPKKMYQWIDDFMTEERRSAINQLTYRSYCMANVLIDQPMPDDFYDLFLIRDGVAMSANEAQNGHRITDALSAKWVTGGRGDHSVLTCYWPMPFDPAALHFTFGVWGGDAETNFRQQAARSILDLTEILDFDAKAIRQVRLTRWAHAMPVSKVGFYNDGYHNALREPIADRVFFANQDNWALPAIETSMMEAFHFVPQVEAALAKG